MRPVSRPCRRHVATRLGRRRTAARTRHRDRLAGQSGRQRRLGQCRHRHPEAARGAHGLPARRTARSSARPDRQPAQRRGQGQPVLPARLQPRPRHRPAHHRRRHAGQPAQPRPRPGLDRPELPDSRAGDRAATTARARTTRARAISPRPAPPRSATPTSCRAASPASASARTATAACCLPTRRPVAAATCSTRFEGLQNDGPFTRPDDYRKLNGVLRYAQGDAANGFNVTAMAYRARWNATDQIPRRAVQSGTLGRFDAIDPTDGGDAHRYSLSGGWRRSGETARPKSMPTSSHSEARPVFQLHLLPRRPGQRRPVRPARPARRRRR